MERVVLVLATLSLAMLAGCVEPTDGGDPSGPATGNGAGTDAKDVFSVDAPQYAVGDQWTLKAEGRYYTQDPYTIVVAETGDDGTLFAGGSKEDLAGEVVWGRYWYGWYDEEFRRDGDDGPKAQRFDFPLTDGKSWTYDVSWREGVAVAHEAEVMGPNGPERGFRVVVTYETGDPSYWTYVPSIRFFGEFGSIDADGGLERFAWVTEAGTASSWIWYDDPIHVPAPKYHQEGDTEVPVTHGRFENGDDHDGIIIHSATWNDARMDLYDPLGQNVWSDSNSGDTERWVQAVIDGTPGWWTLTLQRGPDLDGGAYVGLVRVIWVEGTVT